MNDVFTRKPRTAWTSAGALFGALFGMIFVGNFGIAQGGQAIAVSGWFVCALLFGYIGYRIGVSKERKNQ